MTAWILAEAWPYIAVAGALLFAFMRGRSSAEQDQQDKEREALERAREIENETAGMSDGDIDSELRRDWVRSHKR
jgi:hypothetical protein